MALLLCSALIITILPRQTMADTVSTPMTLIHEDAEQATYEEWNVRWERFDDNLGGDQDWWCRTMHEVKEGSRAIYCARNGYNSHYLSSDGAQPWNINITGIPSSRVAPDQSNLVMRYDTDQDAIMRKVIVGASSYQTITVSFWFWSDTGTSDAKQPSNNVTVGYDFLNLIYFTGTGNRSVAHVAWTDSYSEAIAGGWIKKTVTIPNYATMVGFEFVSGRKAPSGGDSNNTFASSDVKVVNSGMKEGVYLDNIDVTGSGVASKATVATSVDNLASVQNGSTFQVSFTVNNPTIPFDHVNLYYRVGDSGNWTMLKTSENANGKFDTSPITFTASGDGRYDFFTQGFDVNGDGEPLRNSADASTLVDTLAPITNLTIGSTASSSGSFNGPVSFTLSAADGGSGVNVTYYKVDSGSWTNYDGVAVNVSGDGTHRISYYSTDEAGNAESVKEKNLTIDASAESGLFPDWAILGGVSLIALVAGMVIYGRYRK